MPKKIFTQELEGTRRRGRPRKGWKEEVERDLPTAGSEKMESVCGRQEKNEGHCSTCQSSQWAVVPMEEEEEVTISPVSSTRWEKETTRLVPQTVHTKASKKTIR